jgi:hypothetical protein
MLDRRQKILIPLIVIAFIYIGWQVYNIFFAGQGVSAPVSEKKLILSQSVSPQQPSQAQTSEAMPMPMPRPQVQDVPEKKPISDISVQTVQSDAYLKLMKEYQVLEAQRMLLQEKVAIAEMKQKIADLNSKLSQLPSVTTEAAKTAKGLPYKLIYLDHQQGQWTATLADADNVFREVTFGSKLNGGYKVLAVNSKGVVIKHASGKLMQLTFNGVIQLRAAPPKPRYQIKIVPRTKPIVKKQVVKPIPIIVLPKTTVKSKLGKPAPNYTLKPEKKPQPAVSVVELKAQPLVKKPVKLNYKLKPVTANYKLKKIEQQKPSFATVVELKLPPKQPTITKVKPIVKKPVDLNYNEPPKPQKVVYTKAKISNNSNAVITQLLPQQIANTASPKPQQTQQQDNSGPIIMMN